MWRSFDGFFGQNKFNAWAEPDSDTTEVNTTASLDLNKSATSILVP